MSTAAGSAEAEGPAMSWRSAQDDQKLRLDVAIGWAIGSVGTTALVTTVGVLILVYVVDHLLISAGIAGAIITATRLFDAAVDPMMGTISDRTRSRWGIIALYVCVGVVPLIGMALGLIAIRGYKLEH